MAKRFDRVKLEDWRRRLARFDASDLTVAEFCRGEQVSLASYYYWSRRIRKSRPSVDVPPKPTGKMPIDKPSRNNVAPPAIEIWLPGGVRVVVPAGCTEALPVVLQSARLWDASKGGGKQTPTFQQLLVEAHC